MLCRDHTSVDFIIQDEKFRVREFVIKNILSEICSKRPVMKRQTKILKTVIGLRNIIRKSFSPETGAKSIEELRDR